MGLVCRTSLSVTVDAVNAALFYDRPIPLKERLRTARWIAQRQGKAGAYADTFSLLEGERSRGVRVFTGERIVSAAARHIIGEEACRALRLLKAKDSAVTAALRLATAGLAGRLRCSEMNRRDALTGGNPGLYCCGPCSVGLWRHITAGGFDRREERLAAGLRWLREHRKDNGRWRRLPLWYTLSALIEMDLPQAVAEMRHAARWCERTAARVPRNDLWSPRRAELAKRVLGRI
jgi:hypothetical protein